MENNKAGRELDAQIAEQVMGLQVIVFGSTPLIYATTKSDEDGKWLPCYSTSIADAWLVVEKMKETNWHAFIIALIADHVGTDRVPLNVFAQCLFDLTPEKICKAALSALATVQRSG